MGRYYDDFAVGDTYKHWPGRTVTAADNTWFTLLTMNQHPIHFDEEYAKKSEFGKPLVNSIFTLGLVIGVSVGDTTLGTTIGNLGMTEVRFPKPVFHGDTITSRTIVKNVRASKSRPDCGIVEFEHQGHNQRGELVAICIRQGLMRRKPAA